MTPLHHNRLTSAASVVALLTIAAGALQAQESRRNCLADTIVVFDASGSMSMPTEGTERIAVARRAIAEVMPELTSNRKTGLVTYSGKTGGTPSLRCGGISLRVRPRVDAGPEILAALTEIEPDGLTPLTAAVERAANELRHRGQPGIILLITDGEENCGGEPCALAQQLKVSGQDLVVHVIGYMFGYGHARQVACLAEETGGLYVPVDSFDDLRGALQSIVRCKETS
jgi:Ca-activated chloride channel family protein